MKVHKSFRIEATLIEVIQQHQRRLNFPTDTDALEDIIKQFSKSQQSRIRRLLEKEPEIKRVLLSDFLGSFSKPDPDPEIHPNPEVQPQ